MAAVQKLKAGPERGNGASRVPERLQKRLQSRREDADRRKEAKDSCRPEEEQAEYCMSEFNRERAAVEALLALCPGTDKAGAAGALEQATVQIATLQKFVNDSVAFLTPYDLSKAQAALQKLQTSLTEARDEALPKKKFAFRAARAKASEKVGSPSRDRTATDGAVGGRAAPEQCGFSRLSDTALTKAAADVERQDVLLTDLRNCRVTLPGAPASLHLTRLEGCVVLCGPVSGSVFVDRCTGCTLVLACQQLRAHSTTDTRVYLHVTSRAIVEDCRGVAFAPFAWSYLGLDQDFLLSGLDRGRNNWREVDDFNWLAARTPSPNWTVIPEAERSRWDGAEALLRL